MGETTEISWCDSTFNPWIGCTKIAPECENCYAATWGNRFGVKWGKAGDRRRTSESNWRQPLRWNAQALRATSGSSRPRVFCASLADVFEDHPALPSMREDLFALIERCPALDWLLLTKRPENINRMVPDRWARDWPDHVWPGTSAGSQEVADRNVPALLSVPARVRFLSAEPLLGPLELQYQRGWLEPFQDTDPFLRPTPRINWVIVGGESGPGARPCSVEWATAIRDQCERAGVAFFLKQLGTHAAQHDPWGRYTGKGADLSEWPEDLRVRQFPEVNCG